MTTLRDTVRAVIDRWDSSEYAASDLFEELRAALEQPENEPVALIRDGVLCWHIQNEHYSRPTWTTHGTHMLYTTPPQHLPLTDAEVVGVLGNLRERITGNVFLAFARAIEQADGIKGEA